LLGTESHKTESRTSLRSEPSCHDLLVTAQVKILDDKAQPFRCRALLDTGSSMNFITEKLAKTLKLGQRKCSIPIGALNALSTTSKRYITATITSTDGTYERTLTFLIIPTISTWVPDQPVDRSIIQIPRNLQLADPRFHIPAPIEILLSAGPTLASLCVGQLDISHSNGPDLRLQKRDSDVSSGGAQPRDQQRTHFTPLRRSYRRTSLVFGESTKDRSFHISQRRNDSARNISGSTFNAPTRDDTL
jgi:hypothetical protein